MTLITKVLGIDTSNTIDSIGNVIDKIDKSDEKLAMQLKYKELIFSFEEKFIDYENRLMDQQSEIIKAEAKGESWLQRNWRPMLMIVCTHIVFSNYILNPYFGVPSLELDDHIWQLIQMGTTGYVAGRSLEKISQNIGSVLVNPKRKDKTDK